MNGKKIILGITGGIAAYKSALIVRLLVKEGAEVQVIMTQKAKDFITPLTLSVLSKRPVYSQFFEPETGLWNSHVEMGLWADAMLIAPATAVTMAKMANGMPDNLLATTYMSARCTVFFAPAMDLDMYVHPAMRQNIETLKKFGNQIIEAESGELASGLHGCGRMAEPEKIVAQLKKYFINKNLFQGQKILITAGPTEENIDPVRFIGNRSTGKMGYALADEFANAGAEVTLISGPVNIKPKNQSITVIAVKNAEQMYQECKKKYPTNNIAIFAAAVADYTVSFPEKKKLKKKTETLTLKLVPTVDIAAEMGKLKKINQLNIGFALETDNEQLNAERKLKTKNLDMIVLNSLNDKKAGFGFDTNKISIIDKNNNTQNFELKTKQQVAKDILEAISKIYDIK